MLRYGRSLSVFVLFFLLNPFAGRTQDDDSTSVKAFESPNIVELLDALPFVADHPIAREIRYISGSLLELKKKVFDPFYVTNESRDYIRKPTPGTSWNDVAGAGYDAVSESGRDWIRKNEATWSAAELEGYMSFQRSMESSLMMMNTYFAAVDVLSALATTWAENDALRLTNWTSTTTKCAGDEGPEGSILHLEMFRHTKGQRFKFHSANDLIVIATLELADGRMISSQAAMQMWRNTKRTIVAPDEAIPIFEFSASQEVLDLLEPVHKDAFMIRHALLINAAVKDLYARLDALGIGVNSKQATESR